VSRGKITNGGKKMKTSEAVARFGSVRGLAEALGVTEQAIYLWGEYPPALRQYEIEELTRGKLKAERSSGKRKT
jgi:hypothetical protein